MLVIGGGALAALVWPWLAPRVWHMGPRSRGAVLLAAILLVITFGVLRNIPAAPFAWFRP